MFTYIWKYTVYTSINISSVLILHYSSFFNIASRTNFTMYVFRNLEVRHDDLHSFTLLCSFDDHDFASSIKAILLMELSSSLKAKL